MTIRSTSLVGLFVLSLGWPAAAAAASKASTAEPARGSHVSAALVTDAASIDPGTPFWLGIHLKIDPKWHVYWVNPGDSGMPTRVATEVPPGFLVDPVLWPTPERLPSGPLVDYGYAGEAILVVRVHPASQISARDRVPITVRVQWLECHDVCVPGRAELRIELPVARSTSPRSPGAVLLAEARKKMPADGRGWQATAGVTPGAILLQFSPPAHQRQKLRTAYFYSEIPELVEASAVQALEGGPSRYTLRLARAPNSVAPPGDLSGVLSMTFAGGETTAVRLVSIPTTHLEKERNTR